MRRGIRVTAALESETCAHHLLSPTASARPALSSTTCTGLVLGGDVGHVLGHGEQGVNGQVMDVDVDTPMDLPMLATVASTRKCCGTGAVVNSSACATLYTTLG